MHNTTGRALIERAALAAGELSPLPPRTDAAIGMLALIAIRMMKEPISDMAEELHQLARFCGG